VVLPFLLFVFFGIVEFSRAWLNVNILTTAAREGARVGSVSPTGAGQILAAANLLTGATRTVTCATPCLPDSEVRADISVTFETRVPFVLPLLESMTIQQTASMRYE
jgi:Flp pilus assembly protein TadG